MPAAAPAPRAVPATTAAAAPLDAAERLHALDILRGLALFGMILVHFHQKMRLDAGGFEDLISWGVWVLVEQKAWGTFAFLFGVGFAVLLRRLDARGAPVVAIYLRRLAALATLGIGIEVCFGFTILFEYAVWGVALLAVRRWSTRALLLTAAAAAAARPVISELTALHAWWTGAPLPPPPASLALARAAEAAAQQGSYPALVSARWALFVGSLAHSWRDLLPDSNLTLFCIGFLAVRHRVIDEPQRHTRLIAGWMAFGALSWATSWLVLRQLPSAPIPGADWPLQDGLGLIRDQWLCFTYIGAVVLLLAYHGAWAARLTVFGRAGRMALTNYLFQAAVLDLLASRYGVGLKLRPYTYVPAAVALFAVEAAFSTVWLARYRFGPLEWAWRCVTYLRRQPLRRAPAGS